MECPTKHYLGLALDTRYRTVPGSNWSVVVVDSSDDSYPEKTPKEE
jgi:hypothetical protein